MHILVTGGFGFIGSYISRFYLDQGSFVTVIDNLSTSSIARASQVLDVDHPKLKFIRMDIAFPTPEDLIILENCLSESDLVFHMAGSVGVRYIDDNPHKSIQNNVFINTRLFPLLEKYQKKTIYGSTSEVYGETENAIETQDLKIGSPDVLRWGYACSKLMGEFLLKSYSFPFVIVRFFNVTGKGQSSEHGMVLPSFVDKVRRGEEIIIYGDGQQKRSFCDVRDAVNMIAIVAMGKEHEGKIYNIGNSSGVIGIGELARKVQLLAGKEVSLSFRRFEDSFKYSKEIYSRTPDTSRISSFYRAKYSLDETIKEMLS